MNNIKAFLMLAALTALLVVIGGALGGRAGMLIALLLAGVMNFSAYWYSDSIVLKMYNAEPVDSNHPSGIYNIVAPLAEKAELPMPKVYVIEDSSPNAFATGRDPEHAAVAVTSGLMRMLTREEVTGVLAHEMSHVLHRDTLIGTIAATIAGAISAVANMFMWMSMFGHRDEDGPGPIAGILISIFAPMAAMLIQMAISRSREFAADATGAKLCGNPLWLARALERIEYASRHGQFDAAEEHPATAHMFIINPLNGRKMAELFSTHPLTEERVKRLKAMANHY